MPASRLVPHPRPPPNLEARANCRSFFSRRLRSASASSPRVGRVKKIRWNARQWVPKSRWLCLPTLRCQAATRCAPCLCARPPVSGMSSNLGCAGGRCGAWGRDQRAACPCQPGFASARVAEKAPSGRHKLAAQRASQPLPGQPLPAVRHPPYRPSPPHPPPPDSCQRRPPASSTGSALARPEHTQRRRGSAGGRSGEAGAARGGLQGRRCSDGCMQGNFRSKPAARSHRSTPTVHIIRSLQHRACSNLPSQQHSTPPPQQPPPTSRKASHALSVQQPSSWTNRQMYSASSK